MGSRLIALGCWGLCLGRFGLNVAEVSTLFESGRWEAVKTFQFKWQMTSTLIVGAASDILIAALICGSLARMRTGIKETERLLDRILMFTIGTKLAVISGSTDAPARRLGSRYEFSGRHAGSSGVYFTVIHGALFRSDPVLVS